MKLIGLKNKMLFSMILICTLIVLAVSFYELQQQRDLQKTLIKGEFSSFDRGAKQAIREAVWLYDWDMVKNIVENQTSQIISFVEICDNKASRCFQHGVKAAGPYLEYQSQLFHEEPSSKQKIEIGRIYLRSHYDPLINHVLENLPHLLLTNFLSVFGVAIVIFWMFHLQAVKRLLIVEKYTHGIDLTNVEQLAPLQLNRTHRNQDEIDLLAAAISNLVEKIKDEFARREALEQQLTQVQKMEALGTLAGGIAHDFNNILAAILGYAQLSYAKSKPGSKLQQNLEQIINAGQRAKDLISQILVFSRKTESTKQVLNLANVVTEALTLIRASLPASIKIKTELNEQVRVVGDSTQLHQIIMNLASNAGQAMSETGGNLHIELQSIMLTANESALLALEPASYACLKITDNGPGIPEEIQTRVFEPFFTTKQAGKGTGMGLAVVHGIVQSHSGAITLTSSKGEGVRFTIYLPETDKGISEETPSAKIPRGNNQHVMIVDDEAAIAEMGQQALQSLGYNVSIFTEPKAAIQYLDSGNQIDLLISDLTMPEMSGTELARIIKGKSPATPILLWTGLRNAAVTDCIERKIITQVLQKPFNIETLAHAVHQALNGQ